MTDGAPKGCPGTGVLRVLLAEDVPLVREALEALLSTEPDICVVARVGRGDEVVDAARQSAARIAVLDVDMPGCDGIEAAARLHEHFPGCAVLLLTGLPGTGHLHRALSAGAAGFLRKDTSGARLVAAIRTVATGGTVMDPVLASEALRMGPSPLSDREVEVLRLVGQGLDGDQVSRALHLSRGTVRNYTSNAMAKTGTQHRAAAVRVAQERGWL